MFKLAVVFAVFSVVLAAPGFLHEPYAYPAAVSHTSRVDVYSKPLITKYVAPSVIGSPLIGGHVGSLGYASAPAAYSHSTFEVHPPPVYHGYGSYGAGYGAGYGAYGDLHGGSFW